MCRKLVSKFFRSLAILLLAATAVQADSIITGSKPYTFTPGTVISSSQVNADFDYIINQVNTNAAKNGVNSSITALLGLTTPIDPSVGGSPIYNATTVGGTANAITVTATRPAISSFSYTAGNIITIVPTATNTGATTINVNSLGLKNILKPSDAGVIALVGTELIVGVEATLYYDGTQFQLLTKLPYFGTRVSIASASTVDLGTATEHNVLITGTTTVTSFGSTASVTAPLYYVKCGGDVPITLSTNLTGPDGSQVGTWTCLNGDTFLTRYSGSGSWLIELYYRRSNQPSIGAVNALFITNDTGTPTTQIDIVAGESVLCNTSGGCIRGAAGSYTINAATTGVNALDTGSLANNTWYHLYLIQNGTTTASLASTSATSPTMPTGYTYKYRIGAMKTGGSATFLRTLQSGREARYRVVAGSTTPNLPLMASGATAETSITVRPDFAPPQATMIHGALRCGDDSTDAYVAPNSDYSASTDVASPPAACTNADSGEMFIMQFSFLLESNSIVWFSSDADNKINAYGWTDQVNAN